MCTYIYIIGKRNYKYFFRFLFFITVYCAVLLGLCVFALLDYVRRHPHHSSAYFLGDILKHDWIVILLVIIGCVAVWGVLSLTGYHTLLMRFGDTTNERLKGIGHIICHICIL